MAVTDNFNRADNTDLGANWTPLVGSLGVNDNGAYGAANGTYSWEIYSGVSWNADQSAQVILKGTWEDEGVIVRAATGPDGYMAMAHFTLGMRIYRRDDGAFTLLTDIGGSVADDDVVKLAVVSNDLEYFKNSVSQGTALNDNTYATGSSGIYSLGSAGAVKTLDDWVGTGESAGASFVPYPFPRGAAGGMTGGMSGGMH